ncbi:MAG: glutathione peroxidase [Bacteroidia bacterium]|jgi:glutathione peroxidase
MQSSILALSLSLALSSCFFGKPKTANPTMAQTPSQSIYDIPLKALDGTPLDLSQFKGKKLLVVNTASECGYTPQYEGLQSLYEAEKERLVILGCPCNQFGGQEPGSSEQIAQFCSSRFQVSFPMSEKLDVKGENQHPLYRWLCNQSENGALDASVSWNFNKFLIDENGHMMAYYPSNISPNDPQLLEAINR